MSTYETVNENSTAYLTVAFADKTGAAAIPTTIRYRIDCETTGTEVKDWTNVSSPAASKEITIASADNAICDDGNQVETHRITVEATFGAGDTCYDRYYLYVVNFASVT